MSTNLLKELNNGANNGQTQGNKNGPTKQHTKKYAGGTKRHKEGNRDLMNETNFTTKGHTDDYGHPPGVRAELRPALQFVHEIDPNLKCCECSHVLQESVQTACGHRVCERHINDRLEKREIFVCPGGDQDCVEVNEENRQVLTFPDHFARKHIRTLPVYCSNKEFGCLETIPLQSLQTHAAKCNFRKIPCKNARCEELIYFKNLEEHMTQDCAFRIEICAKCNEPVPHALIEDHLSKHCQEGLIKCPYNCGVEFKRKDLESHEESCTSKPKACDLVSLGCDFKGSQEDLVKHVSLGNIDHLCLFGAKLEKQSLESTTLGERLDQMKQEKDLYEKEMKILAEQMGKLVKQYSDINSKLQNVQKAMGKHGEKVISLEDKYASFESETKSLTMDSLTGIEQRLHTLERKTERRPSSSYGEKGVSKDVVDDLKTQVRHLDRTVGLHDVRLAEADLRMDCNDISSYDGHLIWKITGIAQRKRDAVSRKTISLYSPPFYTSKYGYKMCGRVYLNGDGIGKGTHVSLFFVLMKGEYDNILEFPFRQKVSFMILDQSSERRHLQDSFYPDPSSTSFKKPTANMNVASGCPLFVRQDVLENQGYLKDDCIYIKVSADINDPPLPAL